MDADLIRHGIASARAENRDVDDATARVIAAQLHGGQASALYSLASTGSVEHDRLEAELRELAADPDPQIRDWAAALTTYTQHREQARPGGGLVRALAHRARRRGRHSRLDRGATHEQQPDPGFPRP